MAGADDTGYASFSFFDATGRLSELESYGTGSGEAPYSDVAANATRGDHLVVFADGDGGVHGMVVGSQGEAGAPFPIAPRGTQPAVAFDPGAQEYFVVWADDGVIRGKRVSATGAPLGAGVSRVSDRTSGNAAPDVAHRSGAGWLVVWEASRGGEASDVVGQAVAASGSDTGPDDFAVSSHRNLAGLSQNAEPAVAYDPDRREALVVYSDRYEIFGQRVSASNARTGGSIRLSSMGPEGDRRHEAHAPSVAYHPRAREYLAVWVGNDRGPLGPGAQLEAFAQHVSAAGRQRGTDDARLSADGETDLHAGTDVIADPRSREYLATWIDCYHGDESAGDTTVGTLIRRVVAP
jgi:hypothetical protein